jgi:hypothetical protein
MSTLQIRGFCIFHTSSKPKVGIWHSGGSFACTYVGLHKSILCRTKKRATTQRSRERLLLNKKAIFFHQHAAIAKNPTIT